jgi:hypothetical protein
MEAFASRLLRWSANTQFPGGSTTSGREKTTVTREQYKAAEDEDMMVQEDQVHSGFADCQTLSI